MRLDRGVFATGGECKIEGSGLRGPRLTYLPAMGAWRLDRSYRYFDEVNDVVLRVPQGFIFDLASVPRVLWPVIAPFELSLVAPLLHDFLYRAGGRTSVRDYTRAEVDRLFLRAAIEEGVPRLKASVAYRMVRMFGFTAWRG
jgi:hypothetical protein